VDTFREQRKAIMVTNRSLASALAILAGLAAATLGGCCNCSNMASTKSAREGFIESYNESAPPDCELTGDGAGLEGLTLTCTEQSVEDMEAQVVATCVGYDLVGFETIALVGKDGSAVCSVSSDCSCEFE
jgi:hypothetical protein